MSKGSQDLIAYLASGFSESGPFSFLVVSVVLAGIPFLLLSATSYVKISVVLSLLKNAIGVGSIPSAPLVAIVSLLLSLHIMSPVISEVGDILETIEVSEKGLSPEDYQTIATRASEPFKQFLLKHSGDRELEFFSGGNSEAGPVALLLSFVVSELQAGFTIGFLLFLPFLVVDLVIAHSLVGLGMMMLSPTVISLPFKILLFVMSDGWFLLCRSLVLGYQ